ncbi:MAG: hypothetical protein MJZ54_03645 [Bacteroidaceae bacterium]|nr:hypothetical protein [Bacteroidaceae bacterium]
MAWYFQELLHDAAEFHAALSPHSSSFFYSAVPGTAIPNNSLTGRDKNSLIP